MNRLACCFLVAGIAAASACGSATPESAGGQGQVTVPSDGPETLPPVDSEDAASEVATSVSPVHTETCVDGEATASELSEAQFGFVGAVMAVDEEVHPWTTDPENPERADVAETTRWVTFEVEQWYTADWGTTFSVWAPAFAMNTGERFTVGGNAYHTEVLDFSGQSGEVEICASLLASEASPAAWEDFFGPGITPSAENPETEIEPEALPATKDFGESSGPCGVTVLTNGPDDEVNLADGAACFVREFDSGRPLVWDVAIATVEGDPIPTRYDFDGQIVFITTDYSFDNFGSGGVAELRCASVRLTNWLPEGTDCSSHEGEGFRPESLPYGT
jgi:hypothetical protein